MTNATDCFLIESTMSRKNWENYFDSVKEQDWGKARGILNEIAKTEKANPQVYLKMGDVCQRLGDTPNAVKAYHVSARIQTLQGFHQKGIALYKIILRLDPHNAEAISRTEALLKEIEGTKGAPMPAAAAPVSQPVPEKEILPPPVPQPSAEPPGSIWPTESIQPPASPDPSDWFETTGHTSSGPAAGAPAPPAEATAPPAAQDGPAEVDAAMGGDGIPSMDEIFSEIPEDDFQRMLDDLIIPLSERKTASQSVPELFSGLPQDEYSSILAGLGRKVYPNGSAVIEEGDSGDSMFMIKSGFARVVAHMFGREIELARLGEGDIFGEVAFLTGRPRTAAVIASGPLEVYEIGRFDLEQMLERNPEIMSRLEDFYESRVRDTVKKILPK